MLNFDVERAVQDLKNLNFPRFVGTEGEGEARKYIKGQFEEAGLDVSEEEVGYALSIKLWTKIGILLQAILLFFTGYYVRVHPVISGVLAIVLLLFLIGSTRWSKFIGPIKGVGPKYSSKNVKGRKNRSKTGKKVVLLAHYDTKSEFLPMRVRITALTISILGGIIFSISTIIASIGIITSTFSLPGSIFLYSGLFLFAVTILLVFNKTGNRSPGVMDNASGVAVMLELARSISWDEFQDMDLEFVATTGEEVGLAGARNYLGEHREELEDGDTYIINLDVVGRGDLLYNASYGFPRIRTSEELNKLIKEVAEENGIEVEGGYFPTGLAADHMPFVERDFEATWIYSAMPTVHTKRDNLDNVEESTLEKAGIIVRGLLDKLK